MAPGGGSPAPSTRSKPVPPGEAPLTAATSDADCQSREAQDTSAPDPQRSVCHQRQHGRAAVADEAGRLHCAQ